MSVLWIVLALVAAQRVAELLYARCNTARLLERGGVEVGASHYAAFVIVHAAWLCSLAAFVAPATLPNWWLLGLYGVLQGLRAWIVATLGHYWTTRVITVPGAPLVRTGPYRFFRHPNYIVVCAEIAVLPMAFHAVNIAIVFSILNAGLLAWRVRVEERAIAGRRF